MQRRRTYERQAEGLGWRVGLVAAMLGGAAVWASPAEVSSPVTNVPVWVDLAALDRQAAEVAGQAIPARLAEAPAELPSASQPGARWIQMSDTDGVADVFGDVLPWISDVQMPLEVKPPATRPAILPTPSRADDATVSSLREVTREPAPAPLPQPLDDFPEFPALGTETLLIDSTPNANSPAPANESSSATESSPAGGASPATESVANDDVVESFPESAELAPTSPDELQLPGANPVPSQAGMESVAGEDAPALNPADADADPGADATGPQPTETVVPPPVSDRAVPLALPKVVLAPPAHVQTLRRPLEQCLQQHSSQRLNTGEDSCWSIMHSFLGWGPTNEIHIGSAKGRRTNAIHWLAQNQPCGGRRLFYLDGDRLRGREGPGYQGHPAQFLAMLAQCNVDVTLPIGVGGRAFNVRDLIVEEQRTCAVDTELTFKLIGLSHYLGTAATWTNLRGEPWSVERLLAVELAQPVNGAACGGTHRLMGISYAVRKRIQDGYPLDGVWARANKYLEDYHRYTLTLQNKDGSFSSDWFRRRADWGDLDRRVQTTGHILEWLVFSLPSESLYDPRVIRATNYLTQSLIQHRYHDWEVGPKGHTIRALRLYHERVFEAAAGSPAPVAQRQRGAVSGR